MVKKQGGREMNPADAFRKTQRAKEIARNKKERKFQRDAHSMKDNPEAIKEELKSVLDMEETQEGRVNQTIRLKKRALQGAYDTALKKRKEEQNRKKNEQEYEFSNVHGHGVPARRPDESVYYHPLLNPQGIPPAGKPQRYRTASNIPPGAPDHGYRNAAASLPVPEAPPLPAGPNPHRPLPLPPGVPLPPPGAFPGMGMLPPPPGAPPGALLPPPAGPPPSSNAEPAPPGSESHAEGSTAGGGPLLPPPMGPPPGMLGALPPPMGPPPGMPPMMALPGMHPLPPPAMPPPGFPHPLAPPPGPPPGQEGRTTISAASTVIKMPRAQDDRTVTAMVPASVRLRRDAAPSAPARIAPQHLQQPKAVPEVGPGFGLAPQRAAPAAAAGGGYTGTAMDKKYEDFLAEMEGLGALED